MDQPIPTCLRLPRSKPPWRHPSVLAAACTATAAAAALSPTMGANAYAQSVANDVVEPVRLSLVRGEGAAMCPGPQVLEQRVAANLGRNPFALDAPYALEGVVRHTDEGWFAVLSLRGRRGEALGERTLEARGESCDAITRAIVLAIGLTIDPRAPQHTATLPTDVPVEHESAAPMVPPALSAAAPPGSSAVPVGTAAPPPKCPASRPAARSMENSGRPSPKRPQVRVMPEIDVAAGVLPSTAVGAGLSAVARPDAHVSGGLGMLWLSERSAEQGSFGFGLTAGTLQACYWLDVTPRVDAGSCVIAQAGAMHATAYADEPLDPGQKLWLAAGGGERVALQLTNAVFLDVGVDLLVPVVRRDFRVVGVNPHRVFLPAAVAGVGHVGMAVNFP